MSTRSHRDGGVLGVALVAVGLVTLPCSGQVLGETHRLIPPDAKPTDQFGHSVAIDGQTAVIGAVFGGGPAPTSGSAYLYDALSGTLVREVLGNGLANSDVFGFSVAVRGDRAFVGAPQNDARGTSAGVLYGFSVNTGAQFARIFPFQVVFTDEDPTGAAFGWSQDLDERYLVVGAPGDIESANGGSGAVFIYNSANLSLVGKFFAEDPGFADNYGRSVATSGGLVVVGSPFDDDQGSDSGSVYVLDAATGEQLRKITPSVGSNNSIFGLSVDADGGLIAVGAPQANVSGAGSGAVYLFDAATGAEIAVLVGSSTQAGDRFGTSVALSGEYIVAGARLDDDQGDGSGAAFVFRRDTLAEVATLLPSDGQTGDVFGSAVAVSGDRVIVGAPGVDVAGSAAGAAYIFEIPSIDCAADLTGDGEVDSGDLSAFVTAFLAGDAGLADLTGDGEVDSGDLGLFIQLFLAGC